MSDLNKLPVLRNDRLIFEDTSGAPVSGRIVPCLLCMKPFIMPVFIGAPDQICPECWKTYNEAARVICRNCKITICRLVPKVLDNGYYIKPRSVLRSSGCNICQPGILESTILEITEWERTFRSKKIIVAYGKNATKTH